MNSIGWDVAKAEAYSVLRPRLCPRSFRYNSSLPGYRLGQSICRPRSVTVCTSSFESDEGEPEDETKIRENLSRLLETPSISGLELRQLIFNKWGRSFDVRLTRRGSKMYFQVMWKFLEQKSFPLTEQQYQDQLDAVASLLTEWGVADVVRGGIEVAKSRGPGYTGGGGARAISIPLDVDLGGSRSAEWI